MGVPPYCLVKGRPLLGAGVLHGSFGVPLKVFIITALTITKYLKQWFSAVGGSGQQCPSRGHWQCLEAFLVTTI